MYFFIYSIYLHTFNIKVFTFSRCPSKLLNYFLKNFPCMRSKTILAEGILISVEIIVGLLQSHIARKREQPQQGPLLKVQYAIWASKRDIHAIITSWAIRLGIFQRIFCWGDNTLGSLLIKKLTGPVLGIMRLGAVQKNEAFYLNKKKLLKITN